MAYFRSDGNFIYCDAPMIEFLIPKDYFEGEANNFALDMGRTIHVLGVFDVNILDGNGKVKEVRILNIPTFIDINVYDSENRNVTLPSETDPVPCKVITYYKDSVIMSANIIKNDDNVSAFVDFVVKGKLPKNLPYNKAIQIWRKNVSLNGSNLKVPSMIMEMILSVSYRDKNNPYNKFSTVIGKNPSVSQFDYKMSSIREICQYTSTFTAITFEDMDLMITSSLNRSNKKAKEEEAPTEVLLKL